MQNLEARHLIVRHKLLIPQPNTDALAPHRLTWSVTSIVHLLRFAPPDKYGPQVTFQVGEALPAGFSDMIAKSNVSNKLISGQHSSCTKVVFHQTKRGRSVAGSPVAPV